MLHRAFCFALFLLFLIASQLGMAVTTAAPAKTVNPSAVKPAPASTQPGPATSVQITQVRWANHTDAVTGAMNLRLVFDVSGPVSADAVTTAAPNPRLVINIKGAIAGKIDNSVSFDGVIADSLSIDSADGQNTKVTVEMPLMPDDGDYKVFTLPVDPGAGKPFRVVIDINKPFPPMVFNFTPGLKNKLIAIDPGHGGSDPGAIGLDRTLEKTVNLAVALKVKVLLEQAGAKVIMTHDTDCDVYGPNASDVDELKARTTAANLKKADIFLSIHSNANNSRTAGGTTTYFYPKSRYDAILAQNLQGGVVQNGGLTDRGAFPANFYVIKRTIMPAALVELAFLSNPDEEKLLISPAFQQKMAQGIVQGIDRFFAQVGR